MAKRILALMLAAFLLAAGAACTPKDGKKPSGGSSEPEGEFTIMPVPEGGLSAGAGASDEPEGEYSILPITEGEDLPEHRSEPFPVEEGETEPVSGGEGLDPDTPVSHMAEPASPLPA